MSNNQESSTNFLKVSGFQSIKTKILVFALLATIVPSLILGGLSYLQNSKLLHAKLSNEMRNATIQASGKLDLWIKERLYDLRVFSSSYVIAENVGRLETDRYSEIEAQLILNHIEGYLSSVREKFSVYQELILIDLTGKPVATSALGTSIETLSRHWLAKLDFNQPIIAETYFDAQNASKNLLIAESIKASDGRPLGFLAARIDLAAVRPLLLNHAIGGIDELFLVDADGRMLASSRKSAKRFYISKIVKLENRDTNPTSNLGNYLGHHNKPVVGMASSMPSIDWMIIAEMEHQNAYAEIVTLRRITTVVVGSLMLSIGALAYLFGHALVRPVRRLSDEAARVASGNLDVDIPVSGLSEVSYLTQVFNHMVASLRRGREKLSTANTALRKTNKELHQISITDGLTGLYNRKHIMELLGREISRSLRYEHPACLLMLDIDYFKKINDSYGHQSGDEVMRQLADLYRNMVRDTDYVGRYGGEEFMIVLNDSDAQNGAETAERIRQQIQDLEVIVNQKKISVTVSIGVASYPEFGDNADEIICAADEALYQAKSEGRNRVIVSGSDTCRESAVVHLLADRKRASEN